MGLPTRLSPSRLCALVLLGLGAGMACSGSGDDDGGGAGGSVWAPTTVPFDPTCKGCKELGTTALPHVGEVAVLRDERVDDPIAQWGKCVNGILDCIEKTKDESACVASSTCPAACKGDYRAHLEKLGRSDFDARWLALKAVFVSPTSRCTASSSAKGQVQP